MVKFTAPETRARARLAPMLSTVAASLLALSLVACGGSDPPVTDNPTKGALLPMATGHSWTYRVTQDGVVSTKVTTVLDAENVGGSGPYAATRAFKVETRKGMDSKDLTESWQAPKDGDTNVVIRFRELSYGAMTGMLQLEEHWDPPRLHVDGSSAHTQTGVQWADSYKEIKIPAGMAAMSPSQQSDLWQVVEGDATVDVPAGHFEHAVHLKKISSSSSVKEYWYLRGVGKLKETGAQTEELVESRITNPDGALP